MSNKTQLQTNNTSLEALITRVNTAKNTAANLPEAGSGGGSSGSVPTCNILVAVAAPTLSIDNYAATIFENNSYGQVYNIPVAGNGYITEVLLNNVVCGSVFWIRSTANIPVYNMDSSITLLGTNGYGSLFRAPLNEVAIATIDIADNS